MGMANFDFTVASSGSVCVDADQDYLIKKKVGNEYIPYVINGEAQTVGESNTCLTISVPGDYRIEYFDGGCANNNFEAPEFVYSENAGGGNGNNSPVVEHDYEYTCEDGHVIMHHITTIDGVVQPVVDIDTGKTCDADDGEPIDVNVTFPDDEDVFTRTRCVGGTLRSEVVVINQTTDTEDVIHSYDMKVPCGRCATFNNLTLHIAKQASYKRCSGAGENVEVLANHFDEHLRCFGYNTATHDIGLGENSIGHFRAEYCYSLDKPVTLKAIDPQYGDLEFLVSIDGDTPVKTKKYELPAGCHCVKIEFIYAKGKARRVGLTYNDDKIFPRGFAWKDSDSAYHCVLAKICEPSGDVFDHITSEQIKPESIIPCTCIHAWKDNASVVANSPKKHCIRFYGFDGMLNEEMVKEGSDQGDLMDFDVIIDGIHHMMNVDYFVTSDHVNKSTWYTMIVDYVNSQQGLTMTLVQDAGVDADNNNHDSPVWQLVYIGNTAKKIIFWKSGGESIMTIEFDGNGGVAVEGNWDYSSEVTDSNPWLDCE